MRDQLIEYRATLLLIAKLNLNEFKTFEDCKRVLEKIRDLAQASLNADFVEVKKEKGHA